MKKHIADIISRYALLIAGFLFLTAGALPAPEQEGPRIFAPERRYEAGRVQQGTPVSHVFEVKNMGTRTLVIERVQPG